MKSLAFISLWLFCSVVGAQDQVFEPAATSPVLEFSQSGGFFDTSVQVALYATDAQIRFTTDGSYPGAQAQVYTRPIKVTTTTVIRAIAHAQGASSDVISHTYFIKEPPTDLPVVSISVTPGLLFDPVQGLYMRGPEYDGSLSLNSRANFLSHREITSSCELFESDGHCVFRSYTGLRLFGGQSRFFPQKSLSIVARDRYGEKRIRYPLFGKHGPKQFKFLVLRNSGSDFGHTHFRDLLMTRLAAPLDVERQLGRPAHVYINGKYWGMYNLREKINRYFIAEHSGYDKDSIDLIEHRLTLKRGSTRHYRQLLAYLEENSLEEDAHAQYVGTLMDIDNYMDLQIAQIYFDNRDAGGNIRFWRPQTPDGRWRWILYDTDWGFGLHRVQAYAFNSLRFHTAPDGALWPNPPWSTFLLRKILENQQWQQQFVNRFADHLNYAFYPERVLLQIESLEAMYAPELPRHWKRWRLNEQLWHQHVHRLKQFATQRPNYVREHLREYFDAGRDVPVFIRATAGGQVRVNNHLTIGTAALRGYYFENVPIHLQAKAKRGFRFEKWEGVSDEKCYHDLLHLNLKEYFQLNIKAIFRPHVHASAGRVIINEINAQADNGGDWLELYNRSETPVNTAGWQLFDAADNSFQLPDRTVGPGQYLVICKDELSLRSRHRHLPDNVIHGLAFGISKNAESLWLYGADGGCIDSVYYAIPATDTAFTLALINPELDNGRGENWERIVGSGTPGCANPYYYEQKIKKRQLRWVSIGAGLSLALVFLLLQVSGRRV